MRRLGLRTSRTRQRVILRRGFPFRERLLDEHIDDATVLRVHADRPAVCPGPQQRLENAGVVQHEHARIGHEELERRDALADKRVHLQFHLIGELRDDHVEAVVDGRLSFRFLHPCFPRMVKRLTLVLDGEIDDTRRSAVCGGNRPRFEVVRGCGAAKRHVQMCVDVDAAGKDILPLRVDDAVGVHLQR